MPNNILRDAKALNKFCKRFNADFKCRSALGCDVVCPLYWLREVDIIMTQKRLTLGEAYRITGRQGLDNTVAEKIFEDLLGMKLTEVREILAEEDE